MKRGPTRRTFMAGITTAPLVHRDLFNSANYKDFSSVTGCSILFRVKDARALIGAPAHDNKMPRRGEVDAVQPLSCKWGDAERGGPTYVHDTVEFRPRKHRVALKGKPFDIDTGDWVVVKSEVRPISEHVGGNHDFWRILRLPRVKPIAADVLLHEEVAPSNHFRTDILRRRGFYLDLAALPLEMQPFLADDARRLPWFTSQMTTAEFVRCIRKYDSLVA